PVGRRIALGPIAADELVLGVGLRARVAGRELAAARRHRPREGAAEPEAAAESRPYVPDRLEVAPDEALPNRLVVGVERARRPRRLARLQRREGGFRREPPGLDGVVDALERGHVHESRAVSAEQEAGRVKTIREREEAAFRNRLRAPGEPLAALDDPPDLGLVLE